MTFINYIYVIYKTTFYIFVEIFETDNLSLFIFIICIFNKNLLGLYIITIIN